MGTKRDNPATPAVVISTADGRVASANGAALELAPAGGARARCWEVIGRIPRSKGLPCRPGCVGELVDEGAGAVRQVSFVARGQTYRLTCIPVGERVAAVVAPEGTEQADPWERLTPRESEVLRLVAADLGTADIAQALGVQPGTVRAHVEHMRDRFGVSTRAGLVARCMRLGLLA